MSDLGLIRHVNYVTGFVQMSLQVDWLIILSPNQSDQSSNDCEQLCWIGGRL